MRSRVHAARVGQLRKLFSWLMPISAGLAAIECATAIIVRSGAIGVAATASITFVFVLTWARRRIGRGELQDAAVAIAVGLLVASVVASLAFPTLMPVLLLTIVMAVAFAIPYVGRRALGPLCIAAWGSSVLVAGFSHYLVLFPVPAESIVNAMIGLEVGAAVGLLLLSFRQIHHLLEEHDQEPLAKIAAPEPDHPRPPLRSSR